MPETLEFDVAILGGGPAGTTCGTLLRKYRPGVEVAIFEKEKFPREHVGESQLPACGYFLWEMGCWDKVEAAEFPIKVGATYKWGTSKDLWDFEFLPLRQLSNDPRPHTYKGPRRLTAFQVDRARYDEILLRHAEETGCKVFEETRVVEVRRDGDRVTELVLEDGRLVRARYFVDATGHYGLLRRSMGVEIDVPTRLKNIAIWDYWENADWAVEIGVGGTRVQVLSLENGWVWFIPLGPTRTSIGFICPAEYATKSGKTPEELYNEAVSKQERVVELTRNATREGVIRTTKDWSFVAERLAGENWFLVGEAAGFADPILAGGLTLAHDSGRHCAYVILALLAGEHDRDWLVQGYEKNQKDKVLNFIRFADFWYAANGQFTDLQDMAKQIAADRGMKLTPQAAFRWLSLGGFNLAEVGRPGLGGLDLGAIKEVTSIFTDESKVTWEINKYNVYRLDLVGAEKGSFQVLHDGKIIERECYHRDGRTLPLAGVHGHIVEILEHHSEIKDIVEQMQKRAAAFGGFSIHDAISVLETMVIDGWVTGRMNRRKPALKYDPPRGTDDFGIHPNKDPLPGAARS